MNCTNVIFIVHCGALWFFILYQALFVNILMLELRSSQTNTHLLQVDQYQIYCQQSQVFSFRSLTPPQTLSAVRQLIF